MTQPAKTDEDRIAAWREQRAAIAAADAAARRGQTAVPAPESAPAPAAPAEATATPLPATSPQDQSGPPAAAASQDQSATATPQDHGTAAAPKDKGAGAAPKDQGATAAPQDQSAGATPQDQSAPAAPQSQSAPAVQQDQSATPAATARPGAPSATPAAAKAPPSATAHPPEAAAPPSPAQAFLDAARAEAPPPPLAQRRRPLLAGALAFLPLLLTALYLGLVATPLYEARSVIAITRPGDAGNSVQAGLLGGEKPVNLQDVFRAATYIKSRALMDELEAETGFVTELGSAALDPLRRLRDLPALSITRHGGFDRFVETSVDIQSGLLTLYVRAPEPERAVAVSQAVLASAEAQVARLGQALFDQRRADAARMREDAEAQAREARARILGLQMQYQDVDPRQRVANIYARIRGLEEEADRTRAEIQKAQIAGVGENRQTANLEALALQLDARIRTEREQLVAPEGSTATPLNTMLAEYDDATLELELAREAVREAIEAEIAANREAALNRSIFQVVVQPDTDAIPMLPRTLSTLFMMLVASLALLALLLSRSPRPHSAT